MSTATPMELAAREAAVLIREQAADRREEAADGPAAEDEREGTEREGAQRADVRQQSHGQGNPPLRHAGPDG